MEELDVIANEWHVNSLRQRGVRLEEMGDDDRIAVLAHYWRRRRVGVDMLTDEPATVGDLVRLSRAGQAKPRDTQEEMETRAAAVSAIESARARLRERD